MPTAKLRPMATPVIRQFALPVVRELGRDAGKAPASAYKPGQRELVAASLLKKPPA